MDNMQLLLEIIKALIWPLTLTGYLFYYRKEVKDKLKNLQSAKFSADGAEMEFNLEQMKQELENPQPKLEQGQITGRGDTIRGRGIEKKPIPKPGLVDSKLPPYQQLFMINSKVEEYLKQMAVYNNISTDSFESLNMIDALTQKGVINLAQRDKLVKITKLTRAANPSITKDQIDIVRKYYESI